MVSIAFSTDSSGNYVVNQVLLWPTTCFCKQFYRNTDMPIPLLPLNDYFLIMKAELSGCERDKYNR